MPILKPTHNENRRDINATFMYIKDNLYKILIFHKTQSLGNQFKTQI